MSDDFIIIREKGPVDLRGGSLKELQAAWIGLKKTFTAHSQAHSEKKFKVHKKEAPALIAKLEVSLSNLQALINCFRHQGFDTPQDAFTMIDQYDTWIGDLKIEKDLVNSVLESDSEGEETTEGGSTPLDDQSPLVTIQDLRQVISHLLKDRNDQKQSNEPDLRYDYGPRSRYHLVELEKFDGKMEEYPTFRQNLSLCLQRERFRDDRDKALFILKHLSGSARESVLHLTQPLNEESYTIMLAKLDKIYGEPGCLDRLVVKKLFKLPKLKELNRENLTVMITALEAAEGPLQRVDPDALHSHQSEKFQRLFKLLPVFERDFYNIFCKTNRKALNYESLLSFLNEKFELRKLDPPEPQKAPHIKVGKKTKAVAYLADNFDSNSDSEAPSEFGEFNYLKDNRPNRKPSKCFVCDKTHAVWDCEKFKILPIDQKRLAVDAAKACSRCLWVGHFAKACRKTKKCTVPGCDRLHHPLLHDQSLVRALYFEEVGGPQEELESSHSD